MEQLLSLLEYDKAVLVEALLDHLLCCTRLPDSGDRLLDVPGGTQVVDGTSSEGIAEGEGFLLFRYGASRACHKFTRPSEPLANLLFPSFFASSLLSFL